MGNPCFSHSLTISDRAILYAASLGTEDTTQLESRLYAYNRLPASLTEWNHNSPTDSFLGVADSRHFPQMWSRNAAGESPGWLSWKNRDIVSTRGDVFKLYLCILPDDLARLFVDCLQILGSTKSNYIKIGSTRISLNRPDKFVAYFAGKEDLDAAVSALDSLLMGLSPHELPFAAMLSNPVLAWGIDPDRRMAELKYRSWRTWMVSKVAQALSAARHPAEHPEVTLSLVRKHLAEAGIDPLTMSPQSVTFA